MIDLTDQILNYINQHGKAETTDLALELNVDHQKIVGAVKSIEAHGEILNSETITKKVWEVTDEGQYVIENGSHEACVYYAVPAEGISQADLMKVSGKVNVKNFRKISSFFSIFRHHQMPKLASVKPCHNVGL